MNWTRAQSGDGHESALFSLLARVRVWYFTAGAEVVNLHRPMQGMRVTGYEDIWSIATGE